MFRNELLEFEVEEGSRKTDATLNLILNSEPTEVSERRTACSEYSCLSFAGAIWRRLHDVNLFQLIYCEDLLRALADDATVVQLCVRHQRLYTQITHLIPSFNQYTKQ